MKLAADLVSKGATMLGEPCPKCGGIQVRYRGRVYCTSHDDLSGATSSQALSQEGVETQMRDVLLARLGDAAVALTNEKEPEKQKQLVELMAECYDLLQKIPQK
jgi:UPF0148 protein